MSVQLVKVGSPECSSARLVKTLQYFDQRLGAVSQVPLKIRYAPGPFASEWPAQETTVAALGTLLTTHVLRAKKEEGWAMVLSDFIGPNRCKADVIRVHGVGFDDDGVMGRSALCGALSRQPYVVFCHNTYSDGKRVHGEPEDRTRAVVIFSRSVEGELLRRLLACGGYKRLCLEIEARLGLAGTDEKCMEPARLHHLPMFPPCGPREPWFEVYGTQLIDVVPLAEAIVAELEAERATRAERRAQRAVKCEGNVPRVLARSLRGVLLASLIDDQYDELVHRFNNLNPLVLKRCPFADEHGSRTGESDNTLYCFDPALENGFRYPRIRCQHATCSERLTEDFVREMIAHGELDAADVFLNPDYRELYF